MDFIVVVSGLIGLPFLAGVPLSRVATMRDSTFLEQLAVCSATGLLLFYTLVLWLPMQVTLALTGAAAIAGMSQLLLSACRNSNARGMLKGLCKHCGSLLALAAVLVFIYWCAILLIQGPYVQWDARSIWFFHGKMIYHAAGINDRTGLHNELNALFTHADYPKLLPGLAAAVSTLIGEWNDYLVRLALVPLISTGLLGLLALFPHPVLFLVPFFGIPLTHIGHYLSGYVDVHLAIMLGIGVGHAALWLGTHRAIHKYSALAFLAVAASLKNEGMAAAACCALALLWEHRHELLKGLRAPHSEHTVRWLRALVPALLLWLGPLSWLLLKKMYHFHSDLHPFSILLERWDERMTLAVAKHIVASQVYASQLQVVLPLLAFVVCWYGGRRNTPLCPTSLLPFRVGGMFFVVIFLVYLTTPYSVNWHLSSSVARTMCSIEMLALVCISLIAGRSAATTSARRNVQYGVG